MVGGLWLGCHGDLLAAEERAASSLTPFMVPTLQLIGLVYEQVLYHVIMAKSDFDHEEPNKLSGLLASEKDKVKTS